MLGAPTSSAARSDAVVAASCSVGGFELDAQPGASIPSAAERSAMLEVFDVMLGSFRGAFFAERMPDPQMAGFPSVAQKRGARMAHGCGGSARCALRQRCDCSSGHGACSSVGRKERMMKTRSMILTPLLMTMALAAPVRAQDWRGADQISGSLGGTVGIHGAPGGGLFAAEYGHRLSNMTWLGFELDMGFG